MRHWLVPVVLCVCSFAALGQSFEASASFGRSLFPGNSKNLGADSTGNPYTMNDGFNMALRMTLNSWRFFGVEVGYGYNHTGIDVPASTVPGTLPGQPSTSVPAQTISVPIHQGFGDFLVYATPEGMRIRPFAAGGVHFSSFFPPGASAYYGNQETKFGINYGAGLKVRLTEVWGIRFDARYYNNGKPFNGSFSNQSGRLNQLAVTAGFSFNL
jgi:opacity protein-like surface antigen